jgi:hypothetical protein
MILDLIKSEKVRPRSNSLKHASKLEIRDQLLYVGQRGEEGEGGFVFVNEEGEAERGEKGEKNRERGELRETVRKRRKGEKKKKIRIRWRFVERKKKRR